MKRDQKLKTEWPKFWRLKFRGILAKNDWLQLQVFSQEPQTGILKIPSGNPEETPKETLTETLKILERNPKETLEETLKKP